MKTTADKILTIVQNYNSTLSSLVFATGIKKYKVAAALRELRKSGKVVYESLYIGSRRRRYYVPARYTVCRCKCGVTQMGYHAPNTYAGRETQYWFWAQHNGPGHGPVTKNEMRRIKRRKKAAMQSSVATDKPLYGERDSQ